MDPLKLSLRELLILEVRGYVATRMVQHPGWKAPLQLYAFRCPIHNVVENIAKGYNERLECPYCLQEKLASVKKVLVDAS